jgi:hypothetical protein
MLIITWKRFNIFHNIEISPSLIQSYRGLATYVGFVHKIL